MVRTWRILYIYIHCPVKQNSHEQMEAEQWKISLFCVRQFIRTGTRGDVFQFLNRLDESNSWSLGSVYAASSAAFFNLHFPDIGGKDESEDCNLTVLLLDSIYWMDLHWRSPRRFVKILLNSAAILWIFKLWWFGLVRNDNRFQCCSFFFFLFF